jgi:hypothetical protein
MTDSMTKYNHKMIAEQSVQNFIEHLEKDEELPVPEEDKEWLLQKGIELFDTYYVDNRIVVGLSTEEDKESLETYFSQIQDSLGKMFAHIMLVEYKLHLIFE